MAKALNKIAARFIHVLNTPSQRLLEKQLVLQAQLLARENRCKNQLTDLGGVEFSVFSQWGEDGIIDWLVSQIPGIPKTFIEFGVENYMESNTRLLLILHNWRGIVIDGSEENIRHIHRQNIYWRHDLIAQHAFINKANINSLISKSGMEGEIGILSVDIDGNDYWIWQAIHIVSPVIVICEYNAVLGDLHALTVPYNSDFERTKYHYSNLYFGASLPALINLATSKGYSFIGTTSTGINAFFIRNDFALLAIEKLSGIWAYPSLVREARSRAGRLSFLSGDSRLKEIAGLRFWDLDAKEITSLSKLSVLYSESWKNNLPVRL